MASTVRDYLHFLGVRVVGYSYRLNAGLVFLKTHYRWSQLSRKKVGVRAPNSEAGFERI